MAVPIFSNANSIWRLAPKFSTTTKWMHTFLLFSPQKTYFSFSFLKSFFKNNIWEMQFPSLKYCGIAPKTSCPIVLRIPVKEYSKGFNKPCVGLHNLHPPSSGQKLRKLRLRVCALTSLLIARSLRRLQRKVECLIIWT